MMFSKELLNFETQCTYNVKQVDRMSTKSYISRLSYLVRAFAMVIFLESKIIKKKILQPAQWVTGSEVKTVYGLK